MAELTVMALGWGVQSWTLVAMIALGELPPIDYAIHANTTWEHDETYNFIEQWTPWLEQHGVKVVTVTDAWAAKRIFDTGQPQMPLYLTKESTGKRGMLRRSCTHRWKIVPQRRFISKVLKGRGLKKTPGIVEQWFGISWDEVERVKDSDVQYITHRYPLVNLKMTRQDCKDWLNSHSLPTPPKSACVFCPYKSKRAWQQTTGRDLETSLYVDEYVRGSRPGYKAYLHQDRIPLMFALEETEIDEIEHTDVCDTGYCWT